MQELVVEFMRRMSNGASKPGSAVTVWDPAVRLFHWLLVGLLVASYVSTLGGAAWMAWHVRFGYAVLGLVVFRVLWGFWGSEHARFRSFIRSPRVALGYAQDLVRRQPRHYLGHNPLGGLMVMALLALLLVQTASGLFSSDGILTDGPLQHRVSEAAVRWFTRVHHYNFNILWVAASLHVAAVLGYLLVLRENLITPMVNGRKTAAESGKPHAGASGLRAVLTAFVAAAVVWCVVRG